MTNFFSSYTIFVGVQKRQNIIIITPKMHKIFQKYSLFIKKRSGFFKEWVTKNIQKNYYLDLLDASEGMLRH